MDQASASPAASCAHNPAAPRTLPSWQPFEDQAQTVGPPPARSIPRSEPHSEPVHIVPRPSSPALCQSDAKGYLLPDFYSGCAIGISGRLTEGLLLWRSHLRRLQREQEPKSPFVFTSERGAPFSTAGFARMVERAGLEAKLAFKAHPHMLRHDCGYALAAKGHDTRALQAYLGHRNIQHTVRYT